MNHLKKSEYDHTWGEVSHNGTRMQFEVPGLSNADFDRAGHMAFWRLCKHFESGRTTALAHRDFLNADGRRIWMEAMMFVVVVDYNVKPELYHRCKRQYIRQKLRITTTFKGFSTSSLLLQTNLIDPVDEYGTLNLKYVLVNPKTRKSAEVPDWFKSHYQPYVDGYLEVKFKPLSPLKDDNRIFKYDYKTVPSDLDRNGHVNNSVYYRLCIDAASVASARHAWFSGIQGDLANYHCIESKGLYAKESDMNQNIQILVWEDSSRLRTLCFQIKRDQDLLFTCFMTFSPEMPRVKSKL